MEMVLPGTEGRCTNDHAFEPVTVYITTPPIRRGGRRCPRCGRVEAVKGESAIKLVATPAAA